MPEYTVEDVLVKLEALFIGDASVCTTQLASELQLEHQKVVGFMKSIQAAGDYISASDRVKVDVTLKPEGEGIAKNGSHEFVFWSNVPEEGITQGDAMKNIPNAKLGMGKALAAKWISKNKEDGKIYRAVKVSNLLTFHRLFVNKETPEDTIGNICKKVAAGQPLEAKELADAKKRKLVDEKKLTVFDMKKSAGFKTTVEKPETELTKELLGKSTTS